MSLVRCGLDVIRHQPDDQENTAVTNHFSFGPGRREDIENLQTLQLRAGDGFRKFGMPEVADKPPIGAKVLQAAMRRGHLEVARLGLVIAGFSLVQDYGPDCHLEQMSVDPKFMRRGFGGQILKRVIQMAIERGQNRVTLSTFRHVPWNAPFYKKHGFQEMDSATLTPALLKYKNAEIATGLDMKSRAFMACGLCDTAGGLGKSTLRS